MSEMQRRLHAILTRVSRALERRPVSASGGGPVRVVAVSKLQSVDAIVDLYSCGQRVFGENYIKELLEKSTDQRIVNECPDIEWRFIGHLQSNKVNQLLRVKRLKAVETLDSLKVAQLLDKALGDDTLDVMIQVNTSAEQNKNGVAVTEALPLVVAIREQCPRLNVEGLMTIGRVGHDVTPNPDFEALIGCAEEVRAKTGLALKLSFGMSDDFEHAVEMGSDEIRVGTALFGQRNKRV